MDRVVALAHDHSTRKGGNAPVASRIAGTKSHRSSAAPSKARQDALSLQVKALSRLHELAMRLAGTPEPQPALQAILETLVEVHSADFGLLSLYDPLSQCLVASASVGFSADATASLTGLPPERAIGAGGCAFASRARVIVEDVDADPRFLAVRDMVGAIGFRSLHSTPILTRSDEVLGVLSVQFKARRRPNECEIQLADLCARHAADAMEAARSRQALRESEERLQLATRTGKLGIWDWDIAANRVSWSESLYAIHGVQRGQFTATKEGFAELVHPEDRQIVSQAIERALQHGDPYELEFRAVRPDGELIWLFTNAVVVRENGRPLRMHGATMDITAYKRAELAMRGSQERFARFMRHLPGLAWIKDISGRYVFANDAAHKAFQTSPESLYGKTDAEVFPRETAEQFEQNDRRALGSDAGLQTIETLEHEDGTLHHSLVSKFSIPGPDGAPAWIGGMAIDITDRMQAEESLRASEQLYRAMGESIDYGVWICDPVGNNLYASESFLKLVGMTQEQCSQLGWGDALHPDDAERTLAAWRECVRTGGTWDVEHRFRGVDGKWHPILARGVPVRNQRGEITAWAGINLDISRQKQVEQELRDADRRKDEFLAVLAHELRNPLAPIRTGLELMRVAGDDPAVLEEVRATMDRQSQQMVRLIDDLLDVSRITRGAIELRKCRVELSSIIDSAVETVRPVIEELGHQLRVVVPKRPIVLEADTTRLAQVISNLLNNAAKYMDRGGSIELIAGRQQNFAVVRVKDSGIGIPTEMIDRIFDMFIQVDGSGERTHGGLGIGLTLVKRLVEMHGGSVEAHSAGPNQGSEFIVRLPAVVELVSEPVPPNGDSKGPVEKRRVLIVDDNESAAHVLAMLLKALGNEVRTAFDGLAAIELAEQFRPDIMFLDLGMPKLNGYETARRIRARPWGQSIVLAALTGWGQEDDKRRTRDAGFDYHFVKPIEPEALYKLLAEHEPRRR